MSLSVPSRVEVIENLMSNWVLEEDPSKIMTWGRFKQIVEQQGCTDTTRIIIIDWEEGLSPFAAPHEDGPIEILGV